MEKFLTSKDPYIIDMGLEVLSRKILLLENSIDIVFGKILHREIQYRNELIELKYIYDKLLGNRNKYKTLFL